MKIMEVQERTPMLVEQLLAVWEDSVRATHLFLSDDEINSIKPYVPQAIGRGGTFVYGNKSRTACGVYGNGKGVFGNAVHCVCGTWKRIGKATAGTGRA